MKLRRHKSRRSNKEEAATRLRSFGELRRIADRILRLSDADETEITIDAGADALTRFANNTIHQHVAEEFLTISVRTVLDGRTARATTNKTDEESLRRVVAASTRIARSQPKSPGLLPMPGAQKYEKVKRWCEATATATPRERASAVARICRRAAHEKQTAAGTYSSGAARMLLTNSKGLIATYEQTRAEFSITVMEEKSSGWAKASAADIRTLDVDALAARASQKAAASRAPRELAPGRYTAILEPAAALDMVGYLFYDFAGTAVQDRRSCFNDRLGKKVLGDNITMWDDVTHEGQLGAPFDGEGMPRQKVLLVDRGVPRNLVYSRATAKKMKTRPTGHGLSLPNEWGEAPLNLVLEGGKSSLDEMISSTERGILVTRLWYIREVDPYEKVMTGMTRDGTFLVENGRIVGGIRNFRFNQSVLELLANADALGPAARASGEEASDMVIPAMRVQNFHFTEVTKF
ncbi:MAG: TldD/PmbA family protein [Acidobacteria bacterium]|nr:TldD/PmbA family protein [Acidobacteriota bacterium]MCL5286771.1 TldD/PmbA family protein [Acidobacteriota bacterium]